jgi:large-conductance mechanosensitive channel
MTENIQPTISKPLDQKTEAELKREAKARLKRLDHDSAMAVAEEAVGNKVTGSVSDFVNFLRERAIVGLAIGFVVGTQVQTLVKQFITSFVDPLFKLLIPGNQVLSDRKWVAHFAGRTADFGWGALAYTLLDFFFIVLVIYIVVRVFSLERLDKK